MPLGASCAPGMQVQRKNLRQSCDLVICLSWYHVARVFFSGRCGSNLACLRLGCSCRSSGCNNSEASEMQLEAQNPQLHSEQDISQVFSATGLLIVLARPLWNFEALA